MKRKTNTPKKNAFERELAGITIALATLALVVLMAGFGDGAVHAGYIGFLIGLVLSLGQVSELSELGGPLAICFLTVLYSRIVKFICCHFE